MFVFEETIMFVCRWKTGAQQFALIVEDILIRFAEEDYNISVFYFSRSEVFRILITSFLLANSFQKRKTFAGYIVLNQHLENGVSQIYFTDIRHSFILTGHY